LFWWVFGWRVSLRDTVRPAICDDVLTPSLLPSRHGILAKAPGKEARVLRASHERDDFEGQVRRRWRELCRPGTSVQLRARAPLRHGEHPRLSWSPFLLCSSCWFSNGIVVVVCLWNCSFGWNFRPGLLLFYIPLPWRFVPHVPKQCLHHTHSFGV